MPTGPLSALPPCSEVTVPSPSPGAVEGLILPDGAYLTSITEQGPLTQVTGYIERTPVQVELELRDRDDLEILQLENEIFEAEGLLSNGTHRTYVKAQAMCATGSQIVAVVAAEVDAAGVPVPTGAPAPQAGSTTPPPGS